MLWVTTNCDIYECNHKWMQHLDWISWRRREKNKVVVLAVVTLMILVMTHERRAMRFVYPIFVFSMRFPSIILSMQYDLMTSN